MEMMEAHMLNEAFICFKPAFDTTVIKTGMFVMLKRRRTKDAKETTLTLSASITAVREDEILLRIVEVIDADGYYGIEGQRAGDSVKLYPKDVHDNIWEIWPAKSVIPGF